MKTKRTLLVAAGAAVLLAVGAGAGIAKAVSGSEEPVTGPTAGKAAAAAVKAVGGGTVQEVELQDDDGAGVYEVEVRREDGTQLEVHLDAQFQPVGTEADDDTGSGTEEEEGASDD